MLIPPSDRTRELSPGNHDRDSQFGEGARSAGADARARTAALPDVALLDDALFLDHVAPPDHPECGERLIAVRRGLAAAAEELGATYVRLAATDATEEQLLRVHEPGYIEQLGQLAGHETCLDGDTYVSRGSVSAARRAAGAAVELVESLHAGRAGLGIAAVRPPGHHALPDRAMGFCLLNNVAIAAAHARALGRERVLVLDWDVHHGNGTQHMFYADPSVLFLSLHQFPNYPGTGDVHELGAGDGVGTTVNLPLPKGATDAVYAAAFERVVLPIIEQFAPSLALVSAGFDAHERDPLAQMRLTAAGFGHMTRSLLRTLPQACPLGLVLEGGYDLSGLEASTHEVARALFGAGQSSDQAAALPLSAEHAACLGRVELQQSPHWKLA